MYGGYDALNHMLIVHGHAGKLGEYPILSKLPDKFARFLYEFHDFHFQRLHLPPLCLLIEAISTSTEPLHYIRL